MQTQLAGNQFRELLRDQLKRRVEQNSNYSLRSFAKQLGISPSGLSKIMAGKTPVTLSFIEKTGQKLKLSEEALYQEQVHLLNEKSQISTYLKNFEMIDLDHLTLIKDWYHYAILNLMRVKGFKVQPAWISKRLGISLGEVQSAVERLEKVGLLKVDGEVWKDISSKFTSHTNNKEFNEAAKQNQIQLFDKARAAIDKVEFCNRNHTGVSLAINLQDLEKAKTLITKFRREFAATFDKPSNADEVYHLSVALFPLSEIKG